MGYIHDQRCRRAKEDALVEAHVRHLLEVAFYDNRGSGRNAVVMWGQQEVTAKLREHGEYRDFLAKQ